MTCRRRRRCTVVHGWPLPQLLISRLSETAIEAILRFWPTFEQSGTTVRRTAAADLLWCVTWRIALRTSAPLAVQGVVTISSEQSARGVGRSVGADRLLNDNDDDDE